MDVGVSLIIVGLVVMFSCGAYAAFNMYRTGKNMFAATYAAVETHNGNPFAAADSGIKRHLGAVVGSAAGGLCLTIGIVLTVVAYLKR